MTGIVHVHGFTNESLEWQAWLDAVDLDRAMPKQIAVLEGGHPKTKTSDHYRLLVHQPEVLRQHSATFNTITHAPGGLLRVRRELVGVTVSCVNGCIYHASVHAQCLGQLAKRNGVIGQVFGDSHTAGTNMHERAIMLLSIDPIMYPGGVCDEDPQPLKDVGLTDAEILDLIHAVTISAWMNRLILNPGEPVSPDTA